MINRPVLAIFCRYRIAKDALQSGEGANMKRSDLRPSRPRAARRRISGHALRLLIPTELSKSGATQRCARKCGAICHDGRWRWSVRAEGNSCVPPAVASTTSCPLGSGSTRAAGGFTIPTERLQPPYGPRYLGRPECSRPRHAMGSAAPPMRRPPRNGRCRPRRRDSILSGSPIFARATRRAIGRGLCGPARHPSSRLRRWPIPATNPLG